MSATAAAPAPVVVVGTIFVDLKCFPQYAINYKGRNPGRTQFFHGGVGRNVAENMALLGSKVRFSSAVQEGGVGQEVLQRLRAAGIETDGILATPDPEGMGMWVAILQPDGDLACSLSQMPNTRYLEESWQQHGRRLLKGTNLCVLQMDLSIPLVEAALRDTQAEGVRVVGLPGNLECTRARPDLLGQIDTYILNHVEAGELVGEPIDSLAVAERAARAMLAKGPRQVVITLGPLGAVLTAQGMGEVRHVPAIPVEVADTTGAGDSFVAGVSHALARGADLRRAVEVGTRVAAWTVAQRDSVCQEIPALKLADTWPGWAGL